MTAKHAPLIGMQKIAVERPSGMNRRHHLIALLAGFLFLSFLTAGAQADDRHQTFFAEPTSGRRVTHYTIDLPVNPDKLETFNIPDDCNRITRTIDGGAAYKGNIIDRHLWRKAESDCRYQGLLDRHPQRIIEDYVSGYDFRNARIDELPLDLRCAQTGLAPTGCNPNATDEFGMLRYFPISSPSGAGPERADCIPCAFRNGRFRGYVLLEGEAVRCAIDANAPGLRLIAVDFADINGDRILDAVLRFIPIGPGSQRAPLILPLTRMDATSPLSRPGAVPPRPVDEPPQDDPGLPPF